MRLFTTGIVPLEFLPDNYKWYNLLNILDFFLVSKKTDKDIFTALKLFIMKNDFKNDDLFILTKRFDNYILPFIRDKAKNIIILNTPEDFDLFKLDVDKLRKNPNKYVSTINNLRNLFFSKFSIKDQDELYRSYNLFLDLHANEPKKIVEHLSKFNNHITLDELKTNYTSAIFIGDLISLDSIKKLNNKNIFFSAFFPHYFLLQIIDNPIDYYFKSPLFRDVSFWYNDILNVANNNSVSKIYLHAGGIYLKLEEAHYLYHKLSKYFEVIFLETDYSGGI